MMLLTLDIGNTHVVLGVFKKDKLLGEWRIATHLHKTADEYGLLVVNLLALSKITPRQITGAILSSVVPPLTPLFQGMVKQYFKQDPLTVTASLKTGIRIRYDHPDEIGADRIANAAAGYHLFGGPLIIVDFGTATTFCVISKSGDYLGGAIAPGLILSAEALSTRTAKLPKIALAKPASVIGKDTISGMQSGLIFGYIGLVDALIQRIQGELGTVTEVIATGGLCALMAPECKTIKKIQPALTLEGLMIIYNLNR